MSRERISLAELNSLDRATFVSKIGWIYEHSPWVAEAAWDGRPFRSLEDLHSAMDAVVRDGGGEQRRALLQAHPDLAGRVALAGELTPASKEEQSKAGLEHLSSEQLGEIQQLNETYFRKFDFPFIICARLSNLETILGGLRRRIDNDRDTEVQIAMIEISKIAHLRLLDAVSE